jgi:hypothetical protein
MIDTVCLLIPKDKMQFIEGVSNWELYSRTDTYQKFVRNPSKIEKNTGKYFPRLTGYKRRFGDDANVRIEFSVPKLLLLNNLDEVTEKDFTKIISVLYDRMAEMGVIVPKTVLKSANVSSVHYSKNIALTNGYTASYILSEINKIDLRKSFDFSKARFTNDGQCLYIHTSSHQFVLYDKIADLAKGKKRAIDKDQTLYQRSLFDQIDQATTEVLRLEVRLNQKQKLKEVLAKFGQKQAPIFSDIFSEKISKKVVLDYWHTLIKANNLAVLSLDLKPKDLLQLLIRSELKAKPNRMLYLIGLHCLVRDETGTRQLRSIIEKKSSDRSWYRVSSDLKLLGHLISKDYLRDWVKHIDQSLEDYKTFKAIDYAKSNTRELLS